MLDFALHVPHRWRHPVARGARNCSSEHRGQIDVRFAEAARAYRAAWRLVSAAAKLSAYDVRFHLVLRYRRVPPAMHGLLLT